MANCFGIPDVYKGWTVKQGPDDRFYVDAPADAATWDDLREEIDAWDGQRNGVLDEFAAEWPAGSWSIDRVHGNNRWGAYVHRYGTCETGHGNTPREAFDAAVAAFRAAYPDELTAKRKRLSKAREEAERLERELGEAA